MAITKQKLLLTGAVGALQFVVVSAVAMLFYQGGTAWDDQALGYTFWLNMFSDLGRTVSYSGDSNTVSMILFNSALTFFGISLFAFYNGLAKTINGTPYFKYAVKIIGSISAAGMVIIGIAPDDILSDLHMTGVWLWAIPLFITALVVAFLELKAKMLAGFISLGLALVVGVQIGQGLADIWGPIIPITQKIIVYYNVVWIIIISRR